ncbi:MAG: rhomboid family intramembrane serine protease [Thermoguttaceae bacterium]
MATIAIIMANAVVFLWSQGLPPGRQQEIGYRWGFVPARARQLVDPRPLVVTLETEEAPGLLWAPPPRLVLPPEPGQFALSLLTCMFLHAGWLHLIGNMWFLWIFGDNVEDRLGHVAYVLFYLTGGVVASFAHWLAQPASTTPVIGASGAIAAVLGAYAVTWPWARVRTLLFLFVFVTIIELPALLVLGLWFLAQVVGEAEFHQGVGQSVAWGAHIGGFITGLLLMPPLSALLGAGPRQAPHDWPYDSL